MPEPIIRVENLGKKYLIRHKEAGPKYHALRDVLSNGVKTGFGLFNRQGRGGTSTEEFWALKDVSFEVNEGEVVGIIGRNGAGKSTLLKILSRITEPTTGRVTLNGRVASLLEVGTGFHPELSGRENIYLNGTILGMTRREIARKFDEIVAFAEVEKFLDTPVKRYSSGMYVRLAFAVAAHLEPEILVVDEVLAVGDAQFQKKCLGKMSEVAKGGRTVLFVSHNISTLAALCSRGIVLARGQRDYVGKIEDAIGRYLASEEKSEGTVEFTENGSGLQFRKLTLLNAASQVGTRFTSQDSIRLRLAFTSKSEEREAEIVIRVFTHLGQAVFSALRSQRLDRTLPSGWNTEDFTIPGQFLAPGRYYVYVAAYRAGDKVFDERDRCLFFEVEETGTYMARYHTANYGVVLVDFPWVLAIAAGGKR